MSWERIKAMASEPNFAVLSTLMPDGRPQSQLMWIDAEESYLVVNTEVHRRKYRNVVADPRVTVTVFDRTDPYRYVEGRGEVVEIIHGDRARAHIDELSEKYRGRPYDAEIKSTRVMLRIRLDRIVPGNTD